MWPKHFLIPLLAFLLFAGAGCLGFGNSQALDTSKDGAIFRSETRGETWTQAAALQGDKGLGSIANVNVTALELDPQDPAAVYMGTREDGLFYTYNRGTTWQRPLLTELREGAFTAIEVDPKDVCTIYMIKGQKLYKSDTCLRQLNTQVYVETRAEVFPRRISVDWFNTQVVWLGLSNGDVLKSVDGGRQWKKVVAAGNTSITGILVSNKDSRHVLVATSTLGFQKTTDGGKTWKTINKDELKAFKNGNQVSYLSQDAKSDAVVAASKYGLLRSRDFGSTWEAVKMISAPGQVTINGLAVNPRDAKQINYVAGTTFYSSLDGGATWDTNYVRTSRQPRVLLVDPMNASVLYMGVLSVEKK